MFIWEWRYNTGRVICIQDIKKPNEILESPAHRRFLWSTLVTMGTKLRKGGDAYARYNGIRYKCTLAIVFFAGFGHSD